MGLFSFVGKVLKGVSKVASFVPGIGSTISKVTGTVGNLADTRRPFAWSPRCWTVGRRRTRCWLLG